MIESDGRIKDASIQVLAFFFTIGAAGGWAFILYAIIKAVVS